MALAVTDGRDQLRPVGTGKVEALPLVPSYKGTVGFR